MLTIRSPYYNVQAIRRRLKDQGRDTYAKPFNGYHALVNLPGNAALSEAHAPVNIDGDCFFVWDSFSYFTATEALQDGQIFPNPVDADAFTDPTPWEYKIELLRCGRRLHSPEWTALLWCDWRQVATAGEGSNDNPLAEFGGETPSGTTESYHGYRFIFPEPVVCDPSETILFGVRVRAGVGFAGRIAHLFTLCGTRLFLGGIP